MNKRELILSGKSRGDTDKILAKLKADLSKYDDKSGVPIGKTKPNTIKRDVTQIPKFWDRKEYYDEYKELLQDKVSDELMKRKVVRYWELTAQQRTINRMTLVTDKGNHPLLSVLHTAPEHRFSFGQWWIGQKLDSNNFKDKVQQFTDKMRSIHGVRGCTIESYPSMACTVISTKNEITLH